MNQTTSLETQYMLLEYVRLGEAEPVEVKATIGKEAHLYKPISESALGIQVDEVYCHEISKQTMVNYLAHAEKLFQQAPKINYKEVDFYYAFSKVPGAEIASNHPTCTYEYNEKSSTYKFKNLDPFLVTLNLSSLQWIHCDLKVDFSHYFTQLSISENKPTRQAQLF